MSKAQRAVEAIKANPEKSDRAIAADLGVSPMTVGRARETAGVTDVTPVERTGRDGKSYPVKRDPRWSLGDGPLTPMPAELLGRP